VKAARALGADIVIAVDISARPSPTPLSGTIDVLLQTVTIMGKTIAATELAQADVVIKPDMSKVSATDFASRHLAILEGERAGLAAIPALRAKLAEREERIRAQLISQQQPAGTQQPCRLRGRGASTVLGIICLRVAAGRRLQQFAGVIAAAGAARRPAVTGASSPGRSTKRSFTYRYALGVRRPLRSAPAAHRSTRCACCGSRSCWVASAAACCGCSASSGARASVPTTTPTGPA
jgi:hypothetical protein